MRSIGGAAVGSAVTTVGCALFLIFCQLTIFRKLGTVVLVIAILSIFTALVPLPGALITIGPLHPTRHNLPSFTDFWIAFNRLRIWLFPPSEMKGSHGKDVAETTSSVTDRYVASPPRRRRPGTSVQEMRYEVNKPREMS